MDQRVRRAMLAWALLYGSAGQAAPKLKLEFSHWSLWRDMEAAEALARRHPLFEKYPEKVLFAATQETRVLAGPEVVVARGLRERTARFLGMQDPIAPAERLERAHAALDELLMTSAVVESHAKPGIRARVMMESYKVFEHELQGLIGDVKILFHELDVARDFPELLARLDLLRVRMDRATNELMARAGEYGNYRGFTRKNPTDMDNYYETRDLVKVRTAHLFDLIQSWSSLLAP